MNDFNKVIDNLFESNTTKDSDAEQLAYNELDKLMTQLEVDEDDLEFDERDIAKEIPDYDPDDYYSIREKIEDYIYYHGNDDIDYNKYKYLTYPINIDPYSSSNIIKYRGNEYLLCLDLCSIIYKGTLEQLNDLSKYMIVDDLIANNPIGATGTKEDYKRVLNLVETQYEDERDYWELFDEVDE